MKVLVASALIALLTASAYAQDASGGTGGKRHGGRHAQNSQQPTKKVDDGAYKAALKSIPDQRPNDPWGSLRQGSH